MVTFFLLFVVSTQWEALLALSEVFIFRGSLIFVFLSQDVVLPEKPKLKFLNKVPNLKKAKKEMKKLRDIQGPARAANTFTTGQYAIVVGIAATRSMMNTLCFLVYFMTLKAL